MLCSGFAKAITPCGACVASLELREENAKKIAGEINACGGRALEIAANVLEKDSLSAAKKVINEKFGTVDILINGAGGNHPKGTTTKEYYEKDDEENADVISFFDLDKSGIEFVFNLNFPGTLIPTQVFAPDLLKKKTLLF